jgi:hypothetical protein
MNRYPLDPDEGPTAWVEIRPLDTAEQTHVVLKFGTDPDNPTKEMTLNHRETKQMLEHLQQDDAFDHDF